MTWKEADRVESEVSKLAAIADGMVCHSVEYIDCARTNRDQ